MKKKAEKTVRDIVAENVRRRRVILGLTQEELARRAGLAGQTVNVLEKRKVWVNDRTVQGLAKALNVEVHELFIPFSDFKDYEGDREPVPQDSEEEVDDGGEIFFKRVKVLIKQETGERIRDFLESRGVKSETYYSCMRRGALPRCGDVVRIARALGVSVEFLVTGHDGLESEGRELAASFMSLCGEGRKAVLAMVDGLKRVYGCGVG